MIDYEELNEIWAEVGELLEAHAQRLQRHLQSNPATPDQVIGGKLTTVVGSDGIEHVEYEPGEF